MFAVDRFDPQEQAKTEKQNKLASFNQRLKRKRGHVDVVEDTQTVQNRPSPAKSVYDQDIAESSTQNNDDGSTERKPHREKKQKSRPVSAETADDQSQSKVSHILDKFHKYQDKSNKLSTTVSSTEPADVAELVISDLAPVPQAIRVTTRKQPLAAGAGLPKYLQSPTVVSVRDTAPFSNFPLCKKIQENLAKCEFEHAFAVQAAMLPILLGRHLPEDRKDFLVSAPTGSGKTLTYVIPILQTLQSRRITRLRAIVIVPTRELVQQVQSTFESLSSRLGLKIESLSATRSFATEQRLLVNDYEPYAPSNVDILICTPGRLVDHIKSTPRFTLRDLRFLVIDEGDRLLNQSFQGWSLEIDEALKPLAESETQTFDIFTTKSEERCQKLIFSATLSTDPSLLAQLNLVDPALYLVQNDAEAEIDDVTRFTTPATLEEFFVHSPDSVPKPLVLLTTLQRMQVKNALVFTNSNEAAVKLSSLMNRLNLGRCESFTSTLTPSLRRRHLADFSSTTTPVAANISFLVCSDLMARGIDTTVSAVINYDSSISVRQYIHRVGRTARAGHTGRAISLVEESESKYWWNQIGKKISRARPIQRVTLFPKQKKSDVQADIDPGEPVESESDRDDSELDEAEVDARPRDGMARSMEVDGPEPVAIPQVELADVDQAALEETYQTALKSLQSGSSSSSSS
ncbi:ATP-dependent RNA helicase dbp6 [Taphrina deformans PYCC 5710]|uniref:ATP-dependent RNA helicase n=1 Tax=Taphrina deformans (strain PYCC 5710 / ATCC 11124 / CBS 356.35 / IMI 108563 / JCM 9778 / NBRC 8474) TaxID=1097556 RepID=R4X6S3_TAPDE|nr:ATP-dependent RNA helicase dbp6 [Taphrina deformans PYCC 5710]|eukprot:CCG80626.1 ATP-dependent RNA helicase dbp6 [Taphrina deformans PYCC 5710]